MLPQVEDAESAAIELRLFDKDKFDKDDAYGSVGTLRRSEVPRSYEGASSNLGCVASTRA